MAPSSCHTGLSLSAWPCLVSRTQSHSLREERTKCCPHAHPRHHHSFQVPSFPLVFLSVSVDLFRPCHLVKMVEDTELPQDWGCTSSRGPGLAQPFRLVLWPPSSDWRAWRGSASQFPSYGGRPALLLVVPLWDSVLRA